MRKALMGNMGCSGLNDQFIYTSPENSCGCHMCLQASAQEEAVSGIPC